MHRAVSLVGAFLLARAHQPEEGGEIACRSGENRKVDSGRAKQLSKLHMEIGQCGKDNTVATHALGGFLRGASAGRGKQ